MEDRQIVELFWAKNQQALTETEVKYGSYCHKIALNILSNEEDAEECVNDAYMAVWNAIPPHSPSNLRTFLGKLTRNISIDRWRSLRTNKNGGGEVILALEELEECVAGLHCVEQSAEDSEFFEIYIRFLDSLSPDVRRAFLRRYWYVDSVYDIAKRYGYTEGKVKSMLHRTRKKLKTYLKKEGF